MNTDEPAVTLTDFLLARIAEDEGAVRGAGTDWGEIGEYMLREVRPGAPVVFTETRMLADCDAKRRIVELHHPTDGGGFWCNTCSDGGPFYDNGGLEYPCPTLRVLASAYANHEDFRGEWKP